MDIILASGSPRRKELMKLITENYSVVVSDADESIDSYDFPDAVPQELAVRKAMSVAADNVGKIVIGCDTVVIVGNDILGKPADDEDAKKMLRRLSGNTHRVVTGVCISYNDGQGMTRHSFAQSTSVRFYKLSEDEISAYVNTGEPRDKAGAYGIQEKGGLFVESINGDYNNVVGLPAARLKRELDEFSKYLNNM